MTNNKQQTAVEWLVEKINEQKAWANPQQLKPLIKQAQEKYEHEMCEFAAEYAQYEREQIKEGIKGAMSSMCAWTFFKNRRR